VFTDYYRRRAEPKPDLVKKVVNAMKKSKEVFAEYKWKSSRVVGSSHVDWPARKKG